ncbi:MAG TPA: SRPBCC family protein [Gammaproteobacteria bacterium]|nr:SRPBCC family protein [Gammaproteobacteria bacterium]
MRTCSNRLAAGILSVLLGMQAARAADVVQLGVTHEQANYRLTLVMDLTMPADRVRALITDYAHLRRLNPAILESQVLARSGNITRVRTLVRGCIAFFCFTVKQVQDVEQRPDGEIVARTIPALSDFRYGLAHWRVVPDGRQASRLYFDVDVVPSFWVPPLIGPWIIRYKMRQEALQTAANLERMEGTAHAALATP